MNKPFALTLIVALFPLSLAAAEGDENNSFGLLNGRAWRTYDGIGRYIYVKAFNEGQLTAGCSDGKPPRTFAMQLTYEELIEETNAFYEDPSNRAIPLSLVMKYVKLKAEGATAEQLRSVVEMYRKAAAQPSNP
jgi:hypothetical protein